MGPRITESETLMHDAETSKSLRPVVPAVDSRADADLLFMENWERNRPLNLAAVLRAGQIRRTNPILAEAIARAVKENA